jgi:hypothetical protein
MNDNRRWFTPSPFLVDQEPPVCEDGGKRGVFGEMFTWLYAVGMILVLVAIAVGTKNVPIKSTAEKAR